MNHLLWLLTLIRDARHLQRNQPGRLILFTTAEGLKVGSIIRSYPCGHRYLVRHANNTSRIVDRQQIVK